MGKPHSIRATMLKAMFIAMVFVCSTQSEAVWAQDAKPQGQDITKAIAEIKDDVKNQLANQEKLLEAKYASKIDTISSDRKSFEDLVRWATWIGWFVSAGIVASGFFVGKTFSDIKATAKNTAENAIETAIRESTKDGANLRDIIDQTRTISSELETIKEAMKGYAALVGVAESASGFDPLIGYYSISSEIDTRDTKSKRMLQGDKNVDISETTRDPKFRQKAAVVFEKLLKTVRSDTASGNIRLRGETLYNAAASAAKINMDFVSLELMETAFSIDKKAAPEIESRLIRQRLSMSRITPAEAKEAIRKVLARVTGFDVHLVTSEAFNIGLNIADPAGMAREIDAALSPELRGVSYVKLNGARLLLMGSSKTDWDQGIAWYYDGLSALRSESSATRWYEHSFLEISGVLQERPDLLDADGGRLALVLGKSSDPSEFVNKFGHPLTARLLAMGALGRFIEAPVPAPTA